MKQKRELKIPVEVYSRVVGYYRPVQNWNTGKKQEFLERKHFNVAKLKKESQNLENVRV